MFSTFVLIWADGGHAGRLVRWAQTVLALTVSIVKRTDDLTGVQVIPRCWVVERTLAWISKHRRCVRDHWTRRLTRCPSSRTRSESSRTRSEMTRRTRP